MIVMRYVQAIERNESDVLGGDSVANLLVHGRSSVDLRKSNGHQILESCGGRKGVPNKSLPLKKNVKKIVRES